ncbi:GNAT family N-acetyltransferase [Enterococcus sp. LJL128]
MNEVALLYDALNDYLAAHTNYPGWQKAIYPTRETAEQAVAASNLFVFRKQGRIIGAVILNHEPEAAYSLADWQIHLDYKDIFVVRTFAVHPDFLTMGIGKQMMSSIISYSRQMEIKALRLDVYEENIPAKNLYRAFEFQYIAAVDLGYSAYGLDQFELYQKLLSNSFE